MRITPMLLRQPRFVTAGIRLDRVPAWAWLAFQCAALAPATAKAAAQWHSAAVDGLGLLALAGFGAWIWQQRQDLHPAPRLDWWLLALLGTAASPLAAVGGPGTPAMSPVLATLLPVLALAAGQRAFLPRHRMDWNRPVASGPVARPVSWLANRFVNRVLHKAAFSLVLLGCLLWTAAQAVAAMLTTAGAR